MKQILHFVFCVVLSLLARTARTNAFAVGNFSKSLSDSAKSRHHIDKKIWSKQTKVFTTSTPTIVDDDAVLIDERLREEDPIEFISQEVNAKMDLNAIFNTGIIVLVSLAVLSQVVTVDASIMRGWSLEERALRIPIDNWNSYSAVLSSSPIQTKAITSATVYTIGDFIAQRTEGLGMGELDRPRLGRSLLAGLLGHGPISHVWYGVSENLFQNVLHLPSDIWGTAAKVAIDQTLWGPFWNNTYIFMLGIMKMNSFETIWGEMKRTTVPLIVSGLKLWPLAHCVTYGLVPVENRLLWVDLVEILWVTILATAAATAPEENGTDDDKKLNSQ